MFFICINTVISGTLYSVQPSLFSSFLSIPSGPEAMRLLNTLQCMRRLLCGLFELVMLSSLIFIELKSSHVF